MRDASAAPPIAAITALLLLPAAVSALDPDRAVSQYAQDRWTAADGLPPGAVLALAQDADGFLKIHTEGGSARFDGISFTPLGGRPAVEGAVSPPMLEDRDGNLWKAEAGGLSRRTPDGAADRLALLESAPVEVTFLLEDRSGNLWIGTRGSGLIRLHDGDFILWDERQGLSSAAVRTVIRDHRGTLWVGTDGGGLNRLREGRVTVFAAAEGLPSEVVLSVFENPAGTLWIGTAGGGLSRLENGRIATFSLREGLTSAAVTVLYADRRGDLWVGTAGGGINRLREGTFEAFTTAEGLSNDIVRAVLQDQEGDLWIGTDSGLNRFRNGQITSFSTGDGLASDLILSLHEDESGVLWIGTDSGLSRRQGSRFLSYTRRDGLYNDGLRQILDDGHDRLWFCSNKGPFYVARKSLEEFSSGRSASLRSTPLAAARNVDCSGFSQPAAWRAGDGRLFFATNSGLLELDPAGLTPPPPPAVVLEEVRLGGSSADPSQVARLAPGVRDVELRYTAPALTGAERIRFRYRLAPYDDDWIDAGTRRSARYTNLPPGSYEFRVAAAMDGPWSPQEAVFRLAVPKPFYRTQPAIAGMLLLVLVCGRGLYQLRLQQLLRRNRALSDEVARSTAKLQAQKQELDRATRRLARTNRRLQRANEELFERDQETTGFLAAAARDLRQPLVELQGHACGLRSSLEALGAAARELEPRLDEGQRRELRRALAEDAPEALGFISASTERMDQLIHGLLTLSRLGRQKLHYEPLNMEELVRETLLSLGYQIARQGARVEVGELPPVVADRSSIKLVVENLLNNAVLYLDPDRPGRIRVSGEAGFGETTYRVSDNGRGIPESEQAGIFQLFARGAAVHVPGEGLGLAFVRAALERQGGRVEVESVPGEGSTFTFTLPDLQPEADVA